jgi:predicted dehydrogenase
MARQHLRAFADVPGVTLSGLHSRTLSRAQQLANEFKIPQVFESVAELYERTEADLVVVAVPELAMNSVSRACFQFPWTALLEKPAGYDLPDAEEIYRAAQAQNRRVLVGLNRRFYASTRAAQSELNRQPGPRFIHVQDQQDPAAATARGVPAPVVQNWMYANSIHVIDYLRIYGRGEITSVTPVIPWQTKGSPAGSTEGSAEGSPVVVAKIEFDSGDIGLYQGIWQGPGPWSVTVTTPGKCWELRPLEQLAYQVRGSRQWLQAEDHPWDRDFKPGFRLQAQMAVDAAQGRPSECPTLAEALETMRLISAIFGR